MSSSDFDVVTGPPVPGRTLPPPTGSTPPSQMPDGGPEAAVPTAARSQGDAAEAVAPGGRKGLRPRGLL